MALLYKVSLTDEDRGKLHALLKVGEHSARTIARRYILLLAHQGKTDEEARDQLKAGEVFYDADEFNVSLFPTLQAINHK